LSGADAMTAKQAERAKNTDIVGELVARVQIPAARQEQRR